VRALRRVYKKYQNLPHKTVIITGGSSGIGRCTAALLAGQGWRVGIIARGRAGLADVAAELQAGGGMVAVAVGDVTSRSALGLAAGEIVKMLGLPDVWINCAGNGVYGRFGSVPEDEFDRVTAVTYTGTVNGCRVALGLMRPGGAGTIVNVCSAIAFHGMPLMTSYAGAKAAVRGFAQSWRAELRMERSAIRVCTVFPPAVNTPFFSHAISHLGWPARPARPVYQPEVVARALLLAAQRAPGEMVVSGTAALFSFASRFSPGLIAYTMTRLGFEGQLTRDAGAARVEAPTLFAPSAEAYPVHGPFGRYARRHSVQQWLSRLTWVLYRRSGAGRRWLLRRPASP
jgi:NAD(P)-dependent dehydrogenase (short-subunit alcohol dehydrogenase family)